MQQIHFYPHIYTLNTSKNVTLNYKYLKLWNTQTVACALMWFQQQNNLKSVLFQMPVWATPVSMEAPAPTEAGRLNVSVCRHTVETSVRLVSSLLFFFSCQTSLEAGSCFMECPVNKLKDSSGCPVSSSVMFSDLEQCEPGWDKFHGFCYRHFSQRLSWEVAEQHCRMLGAHLVSIMTPEEQSYINSRFRQSTAWETRWYIYLLFLEDWT